MGYPAGAGSHSSWARRLPGSRSDSACGGGGFTDPRVRDGNVRGQHPPGRGLFGGGGRRPAGDPRGGTGGRRLAPPTGSGAMTSPSAPWRPGGRLLAVLVLLLAAVAGGLA